MGKKSFLLHIDSLVILDKMTDEQAGKFIKILYQYKKDGKVDVNDFAMDMAVTPFINQFNRDDEGYNKVVERNRVNGLNGGRPKNPNKPKKPSRLNGNPSKPKKADNDNDNDNDKDNDSDTENDKETIKLPFLSDDFKNAWEILIRQPKWKKKTQDALTTSLKKFEGVSELYAIKMIENAIASGWQGLFPLNDKDQAEVVRLETLKKIKERDSNPKNQF